MYFVRPFFVGLLVAIYLFDVALTFILPHQIDYAAQATLMLPALILAVTCALSRALARQIEEDHTGLAAACRVGAVVFEGTALFLLAHFSLRTMDYLSKGTAIPLADDWLARAELMLGFSWRGYFELLRSLPDLHWLLISAYENLNPAIALTLLAFGLTGKHGRGRTLVEAGLLCAVGCLAVGAFFPAIGAAAYWIPDHADPQAWKGYPWMPGVYFVDQIQLVRQLDSPIAVSGQHSTGLVSFPSLHTALAIVMILVARRTWIFWPVLAYGIVMIAATPIWGGHYLPDLIAGAAMAVCAVLLVERFPAARPKASTKHRAAA